MPPIWKGITGTPAAILEKSRRHIWHPNSPAVPHEKQLFPGLQLPYLNCSLDSGGFFPFSVEIALTLPRAPRFRGDSIWLTAASRRIKNGFFP
jgi:hypothetical protein